MGDSAFSNDGKYYSNISQDGRLRIWDTETNILKQEYTPDLHLTSPPSCLQWISIANTPKQIDGRRKSSLSEHETQCIALGTTSGKILLYSVTQAKVETVLKDEKSGTHNIIITSIDWHRKYGLYSSNKSNYVYQWDLGEGTVSNKYNVIYDTKNKQGNSVNAIKIVPHNQDTKATFLITASWQVCLWRLHNGQATVLKTLGHNTTAKVMLTLASINNNCWLIEGSQNERLLTFWDVSITEHNLPIVNGETPNGEPTPSKRKRKKSTSQQEIVSTPTYNFLLEDAPRFVNVSLKEESNGTELRIAAATRSGVVHYYEHMLNGASIKPIKPSVTIQVTSADAEPLPLQCCQLRKADVLLGYQSGVTTNFERVVPDLKIKTQVLIRGDVKEKKKKRQNSVSEVNKVQVAPARDVAYVEPLGGVARKRVTPGAQVDVPMEARLENLALDPKSRNKVAVEKNLTRLLMQGLHSKDMNLILTVLQKDDETVALQTVSALPADYIPQLLQQIIDMAGRKTVKCACACTWLRAVLSSHAALLLAAKGSGPLAKMLALFIDRRSHLCQLLNLKGRLDLTITQRSHKDNVDSQEAVLDYNDTSTDEEMEAEKYQSDSGQSWDDKDEVDGESEDESDVDDKSD